MVLGGPEAVIAEIVHQAGDVTRGPEYFAKPLVRITPVVRRRAVEADIVELDLPDIKHVKPFDHNATPLRSTGPDQHFDAHLPPPRTSPRAAVPALTKMRDGVLPAEREDAD